MCIKVFICHCINRLQRFTELVPGPPGHGFVIPVYAKIARATAGGLLLVVVAAGLVARVSKRRYITC